MRHFSKTTVYTKRKLPERTESKLMSEPPFRSAWRPESRMGKDNFLTGIVSEVQICTSRSSCKVWPRLQWVIKSTSRPNDVWDLSLIKRTVEKPRYGCEKSQGPWTLIEERKKKLEIRPSTWTELRPYHEYKRFLPEQKELMTNEESRTVLNLSTGRLIFVCLFLFLYYILQTLFSGRDRETP